MDKSLIEKARRYANIYNLYPVPTSTVTLRSEDTQMYRWFVEQLGEDIVLNAIANLSRRWNGSLYGSQYQKLFKLVDEKEKATVSETPSPALIKKAREYVESNGYKSVTSYLEDLQMYDWFVSQLGETAVLLMNVKKGPLFDNQYRQLFKLYDEKQAAAKTTEVNEPSPELIARARRYANAASSPNQTNLNEDHLMRRWFEARLGDVSQYIKAAYGIASADYKRLFAALDNLTAQPPQTPKSLVERVKRYAFAGGSTLPSEDHRQIAEYFEREILNKTAEVTGLIAKAKRQPLWPQELQTLFRALKNQPNKELLLRLDELTARYLNENYASGSFDLEYALSLVSVIGVTALGQGSTQELRELLAEAIAGNQPLSTVQRKALVRAYWHYIKPAFAGIAEEGERLQKDQEKINQRKEALLKKIEAYEAAQRG